MSSIQDFGNLHAELLHTSNLYYTTFSVLRRWPRKLLRRYGGCSDIIAHVSHLLPLDILGSISIVSWSGYCSWVPDTRSAYSGFCHHRTCIRECKGLGTSAHHARVKYRHSSSLHKKKGRKQNCNYHSLQFFFIFIDREPTTWSANNRLQIMVCSCAMSSNVVWPQIIFCSGVNETTLFSSLRSLLRENGRLLRFPKIFIKKTNSVIEW